MVKPEDMKMVLEQFGITTEMKSHGNGHINDTFLTNDNKYIIQRINTNIFTNPDELMENIKNVTEFLRKKIEAYGGEPSRETMTIVKTIDGKNYCKVNGNCFRAYTFIDNSRTIEQCTSAKDMYFAGRGFGKFQKMLADFPVEKLHETIVDFHHTPKRVEALKTAIKEDKVGRANSVQAEIDFALDCQRFSSVVVDGMENGTIPKRVTHNDTKINNILFEEKTDDAVCVIDLDTVMPGSALYDIGDAMRIGASTAAEDETDLSKVTFDKSYFEGFVKGFFEETKDALTQAEIDLIPLSAKLLTYECGIRFLTDYLNGDTYFKVHYENHNLDRARNQFKLVSDIEKMEDELSKIVKNL